MINGSRFRVNSGARPHLRPWRGQWICIVGALTAIGNTPRAAFARAMLQSELVRSTTPVIKR